MVQSLPRSVVGSEHFSSFSLAPGWRNLRENGHMASHDALVGDSDAKGMCMMREFVM